MTTAWLLMIDESTRARALVARTVKTIRRHCPGMTQTPKPTEGSAERPIAIAVAESPEHSDIT